MDLESRDTPNGRRILMCGGLQDSFTNHKPPEKVVSSESIRMFC